MGGLTFGCALRGRSDGHTEEPSDAHLVSAIVSGGEGENVNLDGMHAETADHRECGAKERDAVASSHESVRLSSKTVTDPDFCSRSFRLVPLIRI